MKKAVIYKRVSKEEQIDGFSLAIQEVKIKEYAKNNSYEIIGIYSDEGISARSMRGRKELQKLLEDAKGQEFEIILVWKISRLARNTKDALFILDLLNKNNKILISITEGIDTNTSSGRFIFTILAAQAQFENDIKSENISAARLIQIRESKIPSRFVLGYQIDDEYMHKVDEEAEIVRFIFKTYIKCKNLTITAEKANLKGYRGKRNGLFFSSSIKTILKNNMYIGNENIDRIISNKDFNKVQKILSKK